MAVHFNEIDYVRQLEAAGVAHAQAELQAKALGKIAGDCTQTYEDMVKLSFQQMKTDFTILKWICAVNFVLTLVLLYKLSLT